ncbi:MAG: hypothetical protein NUV91_08840 [Candidatus Omnitrophica bacterium]|nr:hypothetical protein [Candidatus Omnitrophota bacterium]
MNSGSFSDPLHKTKESYEDVIKKIRLPDSPVGIDAQYTHAIVIEFLKQISQRLERLEKLIEEKKI